MTHVDIFQSAKPQSGQFFAFKNVGDSVQGTYIDMRNGTDSFGNQQTIYVLQDPAGKIWNLGFRLTATVIHERMNGVRFGQIVGFRFDEERESKRKPGTKVKIIRVYADPKLVDQDWLNHQSEVAKHYSKPSEAASSADIPFGAGSDEDFDEGFTAPAGAQPSAVIPPVEERPKNDAIEAIRNLAKTKGLTKEGMTEAEADTVIEEYAGFPLVEENLTKIIIKLTGFVSK